MANPLANHSQFLARQRIQGQINLPQMCSAIDADPQIAGAGLVYIDAECNIVTLREFQPICSIRPKRVILREVKKYMTPDQYTQELQHSPRESRLVKEAVNTTLSCAGAFIGWVVVFSGTIAAPFSAGASLVLTYVGGAAAAASSIQCGIGVMRTVREVTNPAANDALDAQEWYQAASLVLDGVSLLGVGASGLTTIKYLRVHKAATGRSWVELVKSLSRQQRKALTDELLSLKHPSLTAKQLKLQQAAGTVVKRYTPTQISHATRTLIRDSLGATFGLGGSGTVQSIAVGLYEEFE
uniref:NAD synthetase n=1 Tax=Pseudomonas fluorescens TaxID=294 RepID=UPI0035A5D93B